MRCAAGRVTAVGDEQPSDLPFAADERLGAPQRQQHGGIVGARAVVVDDRRDAEPRLARPGEDAQTIAGTGAERGGAVPIEVDLVGGQGGERPRRAAAIADLVHAAHGGRVGAEERYPGLRPARGQVLHGDRLDHRGRDAVDEARAAERSRGVRDLRRVEVRHPGGLLERG